MERKYWKYHPPDDTKITDITPLNILVVAIELFELENTHDVVPVLGSEDQNTLILPLMTMAPVFRLPNILLLTTLASVY